MSLGATERVTSSPYRLNSRRRWAISSHQARVHADQRQSGVGIIEAAEKCGRLGDHDLQRGPHMSSDEVTAHRQAVAAAKNRVQV